MPGRVIRGLGAWFYDHPEVAEDRLSEGPFGRLKVALVADYFTADCLAVECRIRHVTPGNYREVLGKWQPDLLLIESAFHGRNGCWRYEIASQPRHLRLGRPRAIFNVVETARGAGIPTVFWNKDDGAMFDRFAHIAPAFDHVFTTDRACIERYRRLVPSSTTVDVLPMPVQPAFHAFDGFRFTRRAACFAGSYYRRLFDERRRFLDTLFEACQHAEMPIHVFDRNHDRLSRHFEFRFPKNVQMQLHPRVPHRSTAWIYKNHVASINVNSVTDSDTMCSRRLLEILACGGIAITNRSPAVDRLFAPYCHVVTTREEAATLLDRLARHGPSDDDLARAAAGAAYVRAHHTWSQRLEQICTTAGL